MMASSVPHTVRLMSDTCLCSNVGLIMSSPSTIPTTTPAVGPSHGMSEIAIAADVPSSAATSGWQSTSTDHAVAVTTTSFLYPFGKSGLSGLSISLETRVALSLGRPSLLMYPPGILPTAYIFSSKLHVRGKKSTSCFGSLLAQTVQFTTVSPYLTVTAPLACSATLPISNCSSLPPRAVL